MSFTNPFSPKTANVTTIPASEVNAAGVNISRAVDGTGGGTYTNTSSLIITGDVQYPSASQVQMSGTNRVTLVSRSITRVSRLMGYPNGYNSPPHWVFQSGQGGWQNGQGTVISPNTYTGDLVFPLHIP